MATETGCLNYDTLIGLLTGRLPSATAGPAEEHILTCDRCRETLDSISPEDTLIAALRAQADVDSAASASPESVLDRHRELIRAPGTTGLIAPVTGARNPAEVVPQMFAGYRVEGVLGEGGMGRVYRAVDETLRRPVAIKVMRSRSAARPGARDRFLREARAVAALNDDHVVSVYHVGEAEDPAGGGTVPFLVMPLLRGETLEDYAVRRGAIPDAEVRAIGRQIALGLAAAHAVGVVHRDVKPANVWLETTGEPPQPGNYRAKVLDFGLALDGDPAADAGIVVGTPGYMAPEQISGGSVDARADLFAFGCVLYRLSTGVAPFGGDGATQRLRAAIESEPRPVRAHNREISSELAAIVDELLRKNPQDRPPSAAAVADRLAPAPPPSLLRWGIGVGALAVVSAAALALSPFATPGPGSESEDPPATIAPLESLPDPERVAEFDVFTNVPAWRAAAGPDTEETVENWLRHPEGYYGSPEKPTFEDIPCSGFTLSGEANGDYVGIVIASTSSRLLRWSIGPWLGGKWGNGGKGPRGDSGEGPRLVLRLVRPASGIMFRWGDNYPAATYEVSIGGTVFTDPPFSTEKLQPDDPKMPYANFFGVHGRNGTTFTEVTFSRPSWSAQFYGSFSIGPIWICRPKLAAK